MRATENQIKAITHRLGPCLVLAGPGSGKTFTIVQRIRFLIESCHVRADQIMVVTFTRDAANQMRSRFLELAGSGIDSPLTHAESVRFGTFHSVFFSILRENGGFRADSVLTEREKRQIISALLPADRTVHLDTREEYEEFVTLVLNEIERGRTFSERGRGLFKPRIEPELYFSMAKAYQEEKKRRAKVDYTDMLTDCRDLLITDTDALGSWRSRYRFFLVDEFQDINPVQFEILRLLVGSDGNLFAVGDDDQSIYSFRGASPELMLRFQSFYPGSKQILLDFNFRNSKSISRVSTKLITHNRRRFKKTVKAAGTGGRSPHVRLFSTQYRQYQWIASFIGGTDGSSAVAVLTRTNRQLDLIQKAILSVKSTDSCLQTSETGDEDEMVHLLKAVASLAAGFPDHLNRRELLQVFRVLDIPCGRDMVSRDTVSASLVDQAYKSQPWIYPKVHKLLSELQRMSAMPPYSGFLYFLSCEYIEYKYIHDLLHTAKGLRSWSDWVRNAQKRENDRRDMQKVSLPSHVRLMTMHASKGLEFDIVIIPDLIEGVSPPSRRCDIEEERRLLYVAMTRARNELIMTVPETVRGKPAVKSRFLNESGLRTDSCKP